MNEEDLRNLRKVNTRLQALEKILQDKIDGMLERLEGLDPDGVEWDSWAEDGHMEPIEVKVKIWCDKRDPTDEEPWGAG